jgi:hypothetical protein
MSAVDSMWDSFKDGWNAGAVMNEPKISGHCKLIEDFQASPKHLYELITSAIERRKIPHLRFSKVDYKEGWALSASREYLRVGRGKIRFEICGAPFGTGFFVSTRMIEMPESAGLLARLWRWLFVPTTFYKLDTAAMYKLSIENAVSEAVQELTKAPAQNGSEFASDDVRAAG